MIKGLGLVSLFVLSSDGFGVRNSRDGRKLNSLGQEDRTKWLTTVPEKWGVDCVAGRKLYQYFVQDMSIPVFSNEYKHYDTGYHTTYDTYDILVKEGFLDSYKLGIGLYGDKISAGSTFCYNMQAKLGPNADFYDAYMAFGSGVIHSPASALLENLYFAATNAGFAEGDAGKEINQVITAFTNEKYNFSESRPSDINMTYPGQCLTTDRCDCPGPYYDHDTAAQPFIANHINLGVVVVGDTDLFNWYVDQINTHGWSTFTTVQQVPADVGDFFWGDWQTAWRCDWTPRVSCSGAALEIEFVVSLLPDQDYPAFEYYRNVLPQCMQDLSTKFDLTLGFTSVLNPDNDTCFKIELPGTADVQSFSDFVAAVPHYDGEFWVNNGFVNGSSLDAASFNLNNRVESGQVSPLTGNLVQIIMPITFEYLSFSTNLSQTIETKASGNGAGVGPNCKNPSVDINRWSNQMINNHIYYTPLLGERSSNENMQSITNAATGDRFSKIYVDRGMFRYESALCFQIWSIIDKVACKLEPDLAPLPVQQGDCCTTIPNIYFIAENAVISAKGSVRDDVGKAAESIEATFPGSKFAYHEFSSRENKTFCAEYNSISMTSGAQLHESLVALTLNVDSVTGQRASALDAIRYSTEGHKDEWKDGNRILFLFVQNPSHVAGDGSPMSGMQQTFVPNDGGCNGDYLDLIPTIDAMKSLNVSIAVGVIDSDRNSDTMLYWNRLSRLVETPMNVYNMAAVDDIADFISEVVLSDFCLGGCSSSSAKGEIVVVSKHV